MRGRGKSAGYGSTREKCSECYFVGSAEQVVEHYGVCHTEPEPEEKKKKKVALKKKKENDDENGKLDTREKKKKKEKDTEKDVGDEWTNAQLKLMRSDPFQCEHCTTFFKGDRRERSYRDHLNATHGDVVYYCSVCGVMLRYRCYLSRHKNRFTPCAVNDARAVREQPNPSRWYCSGCGRYHNERDFVLSHIEKQESCIDSIPVVIRPSASKSDTSKNNNKRASNDSLTDVRPPVKRTCTVTSIPTVSSSSTPQKEKGVTPHFKIPIIPKVVQKVARVQSPVPDVTLSAAAADAVEQLDDVEQPAPLNAQAVSNVRDDSTRDLIRLLGNFFTNLSNGTMDPIATSSAFSQMVSSIVMPSASTNDSNMSTAAPTSPVNAALSSGAGETPTPVNATGFSLVLTPVEKDPAVNHLLSKNSSNERPCPASMKRSQPSPQETPSVNPVQPVTSNFEYVSRADYDRHLLAVHRTLRLRTKAHQSLVQQFNIMQKRLKRLGNRYFDLKATCHTLSQVTKKLSAKHSRFNRVQNYRRTVDRAMLRVTSERRNLTAVVRIERYFRTHGLLPSVPFVPPATLDSNTNVVVVGMFISLYLFCVIFF